MALKSIAITLLWATISLAQTFSVEEFSSHLEESRGRQLQLSGQLVSPTEQIPTSFTPGEWEKYDVEGAVCRTGSQTGYFIRMGDPDKLVIFFEGGGACFNALCGVLSSGNAGGVATDGIFDTEREDNPLKDYSFIFIPYCTGDVFFGDNVLNIGFGTQQFRGRNQVNLVMQSIVNSGRFSGGLNTLLVTGESAGGFGALVSYDFIRSNFIYRTGETPISGGIETADSRLISDSGIAFDSEVLTPCLARLWKNTWNAQLPPDCTNCDDDTNGFYNYYDFFSSKYPNDDFGYISQNTDAVISLFYAFGSESCGLNFFCFIGLVSPTCGEIPGGNAGPKFEGGLSRFFSEKVAPRPAKCSFFWNGILHTHTSSNGFYSKSANGVSLLSWYDDFVNGLCTDRAQGSIFTPTGASVLSNYLAGLDDPSTEGEKEAVGVVVGFAVLGAIAVAAVGVAIVQSKRAAKLQDKIQEFSQDLDENQIQNGGAKTLDIESSPS
eukprot:CAMPEP_0184010044 /NCGR_PEP_ID=MMETSP0954-20121128/2973_1 /TAXON_ID=627963 /ORGANISM="Aplanochytrium sp, Strain PBS07" /LENGTH=492 /DNA_ID=CAMNT_0026289547 /DNA_START=29 /DNA_END=1504 /DNA_ORIENTATION=+